MTRRFAAVLLGSLVLGTFACGPLAAVASATEPTPTLTSAAVDPGGTDTISGGGCVARATVQVQLDGVVLVSTRSTATGRYSVRVIIPVSATSGLHRLTVVCAGANGQVSNDVTVSVNLPKTGTPAERDGAIALACLTVGTLLAFAGKRRSVTRRPARSSS